MKSMAFLALLCSSFCGNAFAEGGVGNILNGVAAIIAAGAPAVTAAIQAKADVKIAEINADAAIKQTDIVSDTSLQLGKMAADTAIAQSLAAERINNINQQGVTDRLKLQLDEIRAAREDALQAERERMRTQFLLDQQRIALAEQQAAQNLALAKETLKWQITQSGLANGVTNTIGNTGGLTVSRAGGSGGSLASASSAAAGALVDGATARSVGKIARAASNVERMRVPPPPKVAYVTPAQRAASAQLLSSFQGKGSSAARGIKTASLGESWTSAGTNRRLASVMEAQPARGSSFDRRLRVTSATAAPVLAFRSPADAVPHRPRELASAAPVPPPEPVTVPAGAFEPGGHSGY